MLFRSGPNIADLTFLVNYLFQHGYDLPSLETANVNGLDGVNIGDVTFLVAFLFRGGPAPVC